MGVAAALIVGGLSVAKGVGEYNSAKSQNRLLKRQGEQAIENRKQEILQTAARQKIGYIQAGMELTGTAQNVMQDTYQTGIKDIQSLKYNYNQALKNNLTQARASLLGNLASGFVSGYNIYDRLQSSEDDNILTDTVYTGV